MEYTVQSKRHTHTPSTTPQTRSTTPQTRSSSTQLDNAYSMLLNFICSVLPLLLLLLLLLACPLRLSSPHRLGCACAASVSAAATLASTLPPPPRPVFILLVHPPVHTCTKHVPINARTSVLPFSFSSLPVVQQVQHGDSWRQTPLSNGRRSERTWHIYNGQHCRGYNRSIVVWDQIA